MRILSTLCLLLLSPLCFSQIYDIIQGLKYRGDSYSSVYEIGTLQLCGLAFRDFDKGRTLSEIQADAIKNDTSRAKIVTRPLTDLHRNNPPLYVIDGIPYSDNNKIPEIKEVDVESIDILKKEDLLAKSGIVFCRQPPDVILITTKRPMIRRFVVKDFLDGERIAGASVSFISASKKDTLMAQADDSGVVLISKLNWEADYSITVSSVGYKTLFQNYTATRFNTEQEILVERDLKVCSEVILTSYPGFGCGRNYNVTKVTSCPLQSILDSASKALPAFPGGSSLPHKIFPNPLLKGNTATVEFFSQAEQPITIKIAGLDGRILFSQPQKAQQGLNRFNIPSDSRWAAGIYTVNLYANGRLLASGKLILQ